MRCGVARSLVIAMVLAAVVSGCGGRGASTGAAAGGGPAQSGSEAIGADSPRALVDRMLTAVRDGDKTALHACFMPGAPDTHLESLLTKKSLAGVTWRVSLERDAGAGGKRVVVEFSPPVVGEGAPYENLLVGAVQDTADERRINVGSAASDTSPAPTGRWVAVVAGLVHHYNPG